MNTCICEKTNKQWNKQTNKKRDVHSYRGMCTLDYLLLSLRGSLPFRHDTTPQGDILGLHSISASPPTFTSVWLFSWFWEKSGATAKTRTACYSQKWLHCISDLSLSLFFFLGKTVGHKFKFNLLFRNATVIFYPHLVSFSLEFVQYLLWKLKSISTIIKMRRLGGWIVNENCCQ